MQFVKQNSRKADLPKGGRGTHLTPQIRARILSALSSGRPVGDVAAEFDVAKSTIYRIRQAIPGRRRAEHAPTEFVAFRVSAREKVAFDEELARAGFRDRSDALRAPLRNSVGLLDRNFAFVGEVKAIYDELSAIGVNVNQIARAMNRG